MSDSARACGFLGFMVPERFGGGGVDDFRYNAVLGAELARHGLALASSIGINTDVVAPYLLELTFITNGYGADLVIRRGADYAGFALARHHDVRRQSRYGRFRARPQARQGGELDVTRAFVDACLAAHVRGDLLPEDAAKAKYWAGSNEIMREVIGRSLGM